jgi:hypothetical protein
MGPEPADEPPAEAPESRVDPVIPARAVLTELARGFLLVQESNPDRARQFAVTFLREQSGRPERELIDITAHVTPARRSLGRYPRGAVEPLPPRLPL